MITTSTYLEHAGLDREILAAFSASDMSITSELPEAAITEQARKLLLRLCVLCAYTTENLGASLLDALEIANKGEAVEIVNTYLEFGRKPATLHEVNTLARRELQQEIVHFSRIVDVESAVVSRVPNTKRLNRSRSVPRSMKVLCELLTVVRSRHIQRGAAVPEPQELRPAYMTVDVLGSITAMWHPSTETFLLLTEHPRRRVRREVCYLFREVLTYLTPREAALAIAVVMSEDAAFQGGWLQVVTQANPTAVSLVEFGCQSDGGSGSTVKRVRQILPRETQIEVVAGASQVVRSDRSKLEFRNIAGRMTVTLLLDKVAADSRDIQMTLRVADERPALDLKQMAREARAAVAALPLENVASLECGHIHLDRLLDVDQDVGMTIGGALHEEIKTRGGACRLLPMVDDDHVVTALKPSEYVAQFSQCVGISPLELIPESSPIIRAIVVALFERTRRGDDARSLRKHGGNLYWSLPSGNVCEVFEDYDGTCQNGCAFFELGLLTYRTWLEAIARYFMQRFALSEHPHDYIRSVLDSDASHDAKYETLQQYYSHFSAVSRPQAPDAQFCALIDRLVDGADREILHLNVLEDYYEVQQQKVRELIARLRLPFRLVSVHFNVSTRRMSVRG